MSKEYRIPKNTKIQDLVRGIINASYWHWHNIDEIQHAEAIKYLNNLESIGNSNPSEALECLERMAYENACCRCEYETNNKCHNNNGTCIWLTIKQALIKSLEQENENKELKEKVKRWHDLLLKSDIDSKGIVVDEIENYWDIKAGV